MPGGPRSRGRYHHGELRAALLAAGLDQLAEAGTAGFSVAEVARRVGVSTASPYRHFADRDRFLAAVVAHGATELAAAITAAVPAGADATDRLAAAAGAYAETVAGRRVGFDVVFAPALRALHDEELARAGRALVALFLDPAHELAGAGGLGLVEQVVALAHGYASLDARGFLTADRVTDDRTAERARRAARALIAGRD